jgi:hypothetical protein
MIEINIANETKEATKGMCFFWMSRKKGLHTETSEYYKEKLLK